MIQRVLSTAVVGLAYGGVAAAFGHLLAGLLNPTQPSEQLRPFFVMAPAASAAVAVAIAWWYVVIRPGKLGWRRGALAGAVGVTSSYILFAAMSSAWLYGIQFFPWLLVLPPIATGWFTVPVGAVLGAALGQLHRWLQPAAPHFNGAVTA